MVAFSASSKPTRIYTALYEQGEMTEIKHTQILERIFKRYPEIDDRHEKNLSNPPEGSVEPPKKVLSKP